jgi:transposase
MAAEGVVIEKKLSVTMRQPHIGGDKLFVNYAGDTCR